MQLSTSLHLLKQEPDLTKEDLLKKIGNQLGVKLSIEHAREEECEAITDLLGEFNNTMITKEGWKHFLCYPWRDVGFPPGLVLRADGVIVGFVAAIFSPANKVAHRFCNISSWILKKPYRKKGLGFELVRELLKFKNVTFTNMSPSPVTLKGMQELGFIPMPSNQYVITPLTLLRNFWRSPWYVSAIQGSENLLRELGEKERKIFIDHQGYANEFVLVRWKNQEVFLIYRKSSVGKYSIAEILYASDPETFSKLSAALSIWFLLKLKIPKLIVSTRILSGGKISFAESKPSASVRIFRPFDSSIESDQIPNLYSELVML